MQLVIPHLLLLIISVDGLRPDAIEKAKTPVLDRLVKEGAYTPDARTIFPSVTLPSHTSMLTGLSLLQHRVLYNWARKGKGFIRSQTCLEILQRQGRPAAMVVSKPKLLHLARGVESAILAGNAADVARRTVALVTKNRKLQVLFVHFREVDGAGHAHGWMSGRQLAAVGEVDRAIGEILKGLRALGFTKSDASRLVLLITSDHGGHRRTHGTFLRVDMRIPWLLWGHGVRQGYRIRRRVKTYDTAATALHLFGAPVPGRWKGKPVLEALGGKRRASPPASPALPERPTRPVAPKKR